MPRLLRTPARLQRTASSVCLPRMWRSCHLLHRFSARGHACNPSIMLLLRACPGVAAPAAGAKAGGGNVRRFDNGFILEDLGMGQPDGKPAKAGAKVGGTLSGSGFSMGIQGFCACSHACRPARARTPAVRPAGSWRWLPLDADCHTDRADRHATISAKMICCMGIGRRVVIMLCLTAKLLSEACA